MLLPCGILLWMMQIASVRSQFPLLNLIEPMQKQIASLANVVALQALVPSPQPQIQEDIIANSRLKKCCAHLDKADPQCVSQYCDLNAVTPERVLPFMAMCAPRGPTVGNMWDCVSSRQDHTACCQVTGVTPQCMVYCQAKNGVPNDPAIYMGCLKNFNAIKVCFRQYLANNPTLYGDI